MDPPLEEELLEEWPPLEELLLEEELPLEEELLEVMPPLEEEQPTEEQRAAVVTWLTKELEHIDATTPPDPGRVTARRLNRNEYNNTIKELLGVDTRPADDR